MVWLIKKNDIPITHGWIFFYTFTDVSDWSKILQTVTPTPLGGLEAKVVDFEILDKNSECP